MDKDGVNWLDLTFDLEVETRCDDDRYGVWHEEKNLVFLLGQLRDGHRGRAEFLEKIKRSIWMC